MVFAQISRCCDCSQDAEIRNFELRCKDAGTAAVVVACRCVREFFSAVLGRSEAPRRHGRPDPPR
eukprot:8884642-Pyramimonas_sp.AAC.1